MIVKDIIKKFINVKTFTILKLIYFYFFDFKNSKAYSFVLLNIKNSTSQIFQDLFILYFLDKKEKGYFIEIGGGDGYFLSNSFMLETKYSWTGIICEPSKINLNNFIKRKCTIIKEPISGKCNEIVTFYENTDPYLSGIKNNHNKTKYDLKTLCLNHLLKNHCNNKTIDYLSIDTEGNELEIISNFNFKNYKISLITIEHNFNSNKRNEIKKILEKNNFKRIFKNISYMDDWYMSKDLEHKLY